MISQITFTSRFPLITRYFSKPIYKPISPSRKKNSYSRPLNYTVYILDTYTNAITNLDSHIYKVFPKQKPHIPKTTASPAANEHYTAHIIYALSVRKKRQRTQTASRRGALIVVVVAAAPSALKNLSRLLSLFFSLSLSLAICSARIYRSSISIESYGDTYTHTHTHTHTHIHTHTHRGMYTDGRI